MKQSERRVADIHVPRSGPRTEPVSLCSLAMAAVRVWDAAPEGSDELDAAMAALKAHLGPLARAA